MGQLHQVHVIMWYKSATPSEHFVEWVSYISSCDQGIQISQPLWAMFWPAYLHQKGLRRSNARVAANMFKPQFLLTKNSQNPLIFVGEVQVTAWRCCPPPAPRSGSRFADSPEGIGREQKSRKFVGNQWESFVCLKIVFIILYHNFPQLIRGRDKPTWWI